MDDVHRSKVAAIGSMAVPFEKRGVEKSMPRFFVFGLATKERKERKERPTFFLILCGLCVLLWPPSRHPELVEGSVQLQFRFMNNSRLMIIMLACFCLISPFAFAQIEDDQQAREALWLADHAKLEQKVKTWKIGDVYLKEASINQVVDFLRHRTRAVDPEHQGINFVVDSNSELQSIRFNVKLQDATVSDVLRHLPMVGHVTEDFVVELENSWGDRMYTRTFNVPDNALAINPSMLIKPDKQTYNVQSLLAAKGIKFPPGASAIYDLPAKSLTIVMPSREYFVYIDELLVYGFKNVPAFDQAHSE